MNGPMKRASSHDHALKARIRELAMARGRDVAIRDAYYREHLLNDSDVDRFATILEWLPSPGGTLLDVGAGTGVVADLALERGHSASGVDSDPSVMAHMLAPHHVASIDALPFEDCSFDTVVTSEVWEHLPVDVFERGRAEVARITGKTAIVTVPNAESLESASTRCPLCGCVYSVHGHVRSIGLGDLATLLPGLTMVSVAEFGPYKVRHRTIEWYLRRRLLGRWPRQPGAACPQCSYTQPGELQTTELGAQGGIGRALRAVVGFPWRRWWLIARYDRLPPTP